MTQIPNSLFDQVANTAKTVKGFSVSGKPCVRKIHSSVYTTDSKTKKSATLALAQLYYLYGLSHDKHYIVLHKDSLLFLAKGIRTGKVTERPNEYGEIKTHKVIDYMQNNVLIMECSKEDHDILVDKIKWKSDLLQVDNIMCVWELVHIPEDERYITSNLTMDWLEKTGLTHCYRNQVRMVNDSLLNIDGLMEDEEEPEYLDDEDE